MRALGKDFESLLDENPKELLSKIIAGVHLYYVLLHEMITQISRYLRQVRDIQNFMIGLAEGYDIHLGKKAPKSR
ncbi:MAG: hypothetical protein QXP38_13320, partial [Nitrososphaerota archaeon]